MIEANRQAILDVVVRLLADRRLDSSQVLGALTALADRGLPPAAISDLSRLLDQTDDQIGRAHV